MQTYFARQPILDRHLDLYAYELLYRGGPHADNSGSPLDGDKATAAVMEGLQIRGIDKITGGKPAFVNFSKKLLAEGVAAFFPPKNLVIEVLEEGDPTDRLIDELKRLKEMGYTLALDDFSYRPALKPLLKLADIIKLDFLDSVFTMRNFHSVCAHVNLSKCALLAEKVENQKVYEKARDLGCTYFQGYFFAKPANMTERTIEVMQMNTLRLTAEISKNSLDFSRVAEIIKRDVGLTYKILKLVNSAFFSLSREITDVKQALVFLGHKELMKWISFISLTKMNASKPSALTEMSVVRARFCEMAALKLGQKENSEAFFLTGIFSLLDVLMEAKMETILAEILLPDLTRAALLDGRGMARRALDLVIALERGDWSNVLSICREMNVNSGEMAEIYADSLQWSGEFQLEG